jgi:hypothetical protein
LELPKKSTKPSRVPRTQEEVIFFLSLPRNLRGELKPMQPMQWQEHKCSSPSHSNPTKATNAMERYKRKNKGGNHKELQDLEPKVSLTKRRK